MRSVGVASLNHSFLITIVPDNQSGILPLLSDNI
jgi:hypothetical protein